MRYCARSLQCIYFKVCRNCVIFYINSYLKRIRRYDEIRALQVKYLIHVWLEGGEGSEAVRAKLDEKIVSYGAGKLDHAVDAMSSIWEGSIKGPVPSSPALREPEIVSIFHDTRLGMRPSLIRSIKEGYFLDRKYWVRRSRKGAIEPIYFSNTAATFESLHLDICESPHPRYRATQC